MKLKTYTDGGASGNPGPAGIGVVIRDQENKIIAEYSKYIGETTNNQAEYQALILALEKAKKMEAQEIDCYLDSELVVKQLNREYKVKDKDLGLLFIKAWNLSQGFKKINFHHIPREKNKEADALVKKAIKEGR
ncbi:MAG: ribonuclease H [Parcubacteria group bacterium Athens1014_10]|nr:MAG: ribonuclease H [Parcubacteria group bacterium Athens1014_10]TSD05127.1 MAG: ribonuclease H [Parcubacteria group bacterium Athens0714_12]